MKINVLGDTVELTVEDFLNGTFDVKEEDAAKKIKVQEIQMKNTQAEFLLKTKKLFEVDKEITDKIEEKETEAKNAELRKKNEEACFKNVENYKKIIQIGDNNG